MYQDDEQETAQDSDLGPSAIVGWMATASDGIHDTNVAEYCSRLGSRNYNFLNYPVGGMKRSSWRPEKLVHRCANIYLYSLKEREGAESKDASKVGNVDFVNERGGR